MKLLSNIALAKLIIAGLLGGLVFIMALIASNSSLSCVDTNGCLRSWCKFEWLKVEYQILVSKKQRLCRFQSITGLLPFNKTNIVNFLRGSDDEL